MPGLFPLPIACPKARQEIIVHLLLAQVHAALQVGAARQLVGRTVTGYLYFTETGEFHAVSVDEARVKQILKKHFHGSHTDN